MLNDFILWFCNMNVAIMPFCLAFVLGGRVVRIFYNALWGRLEV